MKSKNRRKKRAKIRRAKHELIDPKRDEFARTMAYDSGIVEQHAREGYEKSSVRTYEKKITEKYLLKREKKAA